MAILGKQANILSTPTPQASTPVANGMLQTAAALNASLQQVKDNTGNNSTLYLSTIAAAINSPVSIGQNTAPTAGTLLELKGLGSTGATETFNFKNNSLQSVLGATDNGYLWWGEAGGAGKFYMNTGGNIAQFGIYNGNHDVNFKSMYLKRGGGAGYGVSFEPTDIPSNFYPSTFVSIKGNGNSGSSASFSTGNNSGARNITAFDDASTLIASPLYIGENNGSISNYAARLSSGGSNIFHLAADAYGSLNSILNLGLGEASISQAIEGLSGNGSALFSINSTTKGFRTPRMTTAQFAAIASKAQGLEAYSTDDAGKLWYDGTRIVGYRYNGSNFQGYNGSSWSNLGGLTNFTESFTNIAGATSKLSATNAATNVNAAMEPKGNGAVLAQTPDGTSTAGNGRGAYAVDFQRVRSYATQVASGDGSTIGGGQQNEASNTFATVGGGSNNAATAIYGTVPGGNAGKAYLYGQRSHSSGGFTATNLPPGEAQTSDLVARKNATGLSAAANTELFLDGSSTLLIPEGNNRAWSALVKVAAVCTAVGSGTGTVGDLYSSVWHVACKRVGGILSVAGAYLVNSHVNAGMAGATMAFTAGPSNNLKIEFTAPTSANNSDFRIVSHIELAEVVW